jgi:hypothetical protein
MQSTFNELERKLRELEAELRSATAPAPPQPPPAPDPPPPPPPPPPAPERSAESLVADARARVGGLHDQLEELLRFRDQLAEAATALVEDYSRVLEQIARVTEAAAPPLPPAPAEGHVTFPVPPPAAPSSEGSLFNGHVAVDAGPFADIATLAAFEQALRGVPHAEDVYVRSFEGHRALLELRLSGEVALVFELRRVCDQAFDVEHADGGRLILTMHSTANLPFPMRPANEREAPPIPPQPNGDAD